MADTVESFLEIQAKIIDANRQLKLVSAQYDTAQKGVKRATITSNEISTLSPTTRTYKAVGRTFVFHTVKESLDDLKASIDKNEAELETLEKSKHYYERQLKDYEAQLREAINALQKSGMASQANAAAAATASSGDSSAAPSAKSLSSSTK